MAFVFKKVLSDTENFSTKTAETTDFLCCFRVSSAKSARQILLERVLAQAVAVEFQVFHVTRHRLSEIFIDIDLREILA